MARIKPEVLWNSGYFKKHPRLADVRRIVDLAHHDFDVRLEDKHRNFANVEDLASYWSALEGHLDIQFIDPDAESSRLSLVLDDMGTVIHGVYRTPKHVALTEELIRLLQQMQPRDDKADGFPQQHQQPSFQADELVRQTSDGFLRRNSDSLVVGAVLAVISLILAIIAGKFGLPI